MILVITLSITYFIFCIWLINGLSSLNLEVPKNIKNDFISVNLAHINFSEQVELFNNSECIAGLHGAGFANIVFCQPGTKVIEFRSADAGPVIENLAKINNLNYYSIISEAQPIHQYGFPNQQGSIEIPINKLREVLKN